MRVGFKLFAMAVVVAAVAGAVVIWSGVTRAEKAGDDLTSKMLDAYKDTKTYQATVHFEVRQLQGRWRMTQSADFKIAFDRAAGKVLIDKPDLLVVADGRKLRARAEQMADHYLEMPQPSPLDYDGVAKALSLNNKSWLSRPPLPDVILLLATDPIAALTGATAADAKAEAPAPDDPRHRPALRIATPEGSTVLRLDPATFLVTAVTMDVMLPPDPDAITGPDAHNQKATFNYEIAVDHRNQPVDAATFAFDTTHATAAGSMTELADAAGTGGEDGPPPLEGKPAPPINARTLDGNVFDLASEKADIVIFDFWALWCDPCRKELPVLQKFADWAKSEKKPVALYTINVQDPPDLVKTFWAGSRFTMPVIMDPDRKIAEPYGADDFPYVVVVNKGKVVRVLLGIRPHVDDVLKEEVESLLKK